MAVNPIMTGQTNYMLRGGPLELPLQMLREKGILGTEYVFREYPKHIRISRGVQTVKMQTVTSDKQVLQWEEDKELFDTFTVNSEEEEERVLSGGRTSAQLEEERMGLLQRCRNMNIPADSSWSAVRLRRLLGDALDAPAPGNDMEKMEAELASLKKMAAMQTEIDALRAQLAAPAVDADEMRAQLADLGVKADGRWSVARLREELEKATQG